MGKNIKRKWPQLALRHKYKTAEKEKLNKLRINQ
jgi:hypothetical protein